MTNEIKEVFPVVGVADDGQVNGLADKLAQLTDAMALEVDSRQAVVVGKRHLAQWRKDRTEVKSARTKSVKLFKERLEGQYPELALIEKRLDELIDEQDSQIKPFMADIYAERLEKANAEADIFGASRNWLAGEVKLPAEITNEEFWTTKDELNAKGRKKVQDEVKLHELELSKQEAEDKLAKENVYLPKKVIQDIFAKLANRKDDEVFDKMDVVRFLLPLKSYMN